MAKFRAFLAAIPAMISSTPSIMIFIFLFVYLVVFGVLGWWIPQLEPGSQIQLVLGNYTNVLSALGASLAAGAGTLHAKSMKSLNSKHQQLHDTIARLETKLDALGSAPASPPASQASSAASPATSGAAAATPPATPSAVSAPGEPSTP